MLKMPDGSLYFSLISKLLIELDVILHPEGQGCLLELYLCCAFFSQPFNFKNLILALYFINVELNVLAVCLHRVDLLRSHFVCPDISWLYLTIARQYWQTCNFRMVKIWWMRVCWNSTLNSGKIIGFQAKYWMGYVPTSIDIGFVVSVMKVVKEYMKFIQ